MDCLCDDIANEFVEYLTVASFASMRGVSKRWHEFLGASSAAQLDSPRRRRRFNTTTELDEEFAVFIEEKIWSLRTNRYSLQQPFDGTAPQVAVALNTICKGVARDTWGGGFYDILPIPPNSAVSTLLNHCLEEQQCLHQRSPVPPGRPTAPTSLQNFINTVGFIFSNQGLEFAPYCRVWQGMFSPDGFRGNLHRKVNTIKETRSALSSGGTGFRLSDFLPTSENKVFNERMLCQWMPNYASLLPLVTQVRDVGPARALADVLCGMTSNLTDEHKEDVNKFIEALANPQCTCTTTNNIDVRDVSKKSAASGSSIDVVFVSQQQHNHHFDSVNDANDFCLHRGTGFFWRHSETLCWYRVTIYQGYRRMEEVD